MTEIKKYTPGTFCWTDLCALDLNGAKKFYQGLFGWETKDHTMENGEPYSIFHVDGKEVCAAFSQPEEMRKENIPPNWLAYISVTNADEAAKRAEKAGGKICTAPFDVMDVGRMSVLIDPTGASFAVWQARKHIGARVYDMPGTVCWRELMTPNMDIAGKFYSNVFDWKFHTEKMSGLDYMMFKVGEEAVCGIPAHANKDKKIPPHWLTYWVVENCEKSLSKAEALQAKVIVPATQIPSVGTFSVLSDPQGAAFGVMQFE